MALQFLAARLWATILLGRVDLGGGREPIPLVLEVADGGYLSVGSVQIRDLTFALGYAWGAK